MQGGEEEVHPLRYELRGMGHFPEDILFCVDADAEVSVEMKVGTQGKGLCRLDAINQAGHHPVRALQAHGQCASSVRVCHSSEVGIMGMHLLIVSRVSRNSLACAPKSFHSVLSL